MTNAEKKPYKRYQDKLTMLRDYYFILDEDGKTPIPCNDLIEWAKWFGEHDRQIARTEVDDIVISTIFLALDHAPYGKPELFESMIFGGPMDQECWRYSDYNEAVSGHWSIVEMIQNGEVVQ